jgi:hypothetical protein
MSSKHDTMPAALRKTEWLSGDVCPKAVGTGSFARISVTGNRRNDQAITRGSGIG